MCLVKLNQQHAFPMKVPGFLGDAGPTTQLVDLPLACEQVTMVLIVCSWFWDHMGGPPIHCCGIIEDMFAWKFQ